MLKTFVFITLLFAFSCNTYDDKKVEKSAIVVLSEKIKEKPKNIELLLERVALNKSKNNLESMLFDYKEVIKLDSLNSDYQFNIAEIYFELSKEQNANPKYPSLVKYHLEKSIKINDNNYYSYALMGELMMAYGAFNPNSYMEAIEFFNNSLKIEYNQAKTHMLLGYTFKQVGKEDFAINCFRNSININPDFYESYVQLGQVFHVRKDTLAVTYYNNALRINPTDELTLYNKALFYQDMEQWNEALDAYAGLHKIAPFNSSGHYNLGFIHMKLGLYDVATNNFSDAIYSNSNFYEAYYSRGNCFETLGNVKQAEVDYNRAIEINPEYTYAIDALESLRTKNKKYNK